MGSRGPTAYLHSGVERERESEGENVMERFRELFSSET